jgi:hypothetical protein
LEPEVRPVQLFNSSLEGEQPVAQVGTETEVNLLSVQNNPCCQLLLVRLAMPKYS